MTIRTLVLSGGGGRGAFHAGVYRYLCEANKPGINETHRDAWIPDIVVGTSIGAVNGAAITQGVSAEDLEAFWLSLRETDVQGLPPAMGSMARRVTNWVLKRVIGATLPVVPDDVATSPPAQESWPYIPATPRPLSKQLIGHFSNVLDTGPLRQTLVNRLGLDEKKIAGSDKTLLINATNIRTGEGVIFCNRIVKPRDTDLPRNDVRLGITINRIIASCSIPLLYPWTEDRDGELYWDGALVANTPLGAAFDAVSGRPIDEPMEIVVVLLSPWWEHTMSPAAMYDRLPRDFIEAATLALDWTMLASFRVSLRMLRAFNKIAEKEQASGQPLRYRLVSDVMVAPREFLPIARIIDYDEAASRELIDLGYAAAQRAFQSKFAEGK